MPDDVTAEVIEYLFTASLAVSSSIFEYLRVSWGVVLIFYLGRGSQSGHPVPSIPKQPRPRPPFNAPPPIVFSAKTSAKKNKQTKQTKNKRETKYRKSIRGADNGDNHRDGNENDDRNDNDDNDDDNG